MTENIIFEFVNTFDLCRVLLAQQKIKVFFKASEYFQPVFEFLKQEPLYNYSLIRL